MPENVWDYPRPPRAERTTKHVTVVFAGVTVVDSRRAVRLLETSHPPVYYVPREDVLDGVLVPLERSSFCEWKGMASYFDLHVGDRVARAVAWAYANPSPPFAELRGHVAFYAGPMDGCFVDGEKVVPQSGGFYGGWITKDLVGPFKGEPGSRGW